MDRTVPQTGTEEIALYIRTYYSLLRSSHAVQLDALVEAHLAVNSSLHINARDAAPDAAVLFYTISRLPTCIAQVNLVVMGQTDRVFHDYGYTDVENWRRVIGSGTPPPYPFDGQETLAAYIASRSDIDDLIPTSGRLPDRMEQAARDHAVGLGTGQSGGVCGGFVAVAHGGTGARAGYDRGRSQPVCKERGVRT